jgi:hypothetical protein
MMRPFNLALSFFIQEATAAADIALKKAGERTAGQAGSFPNVIVVC